MHSVTITLDFATPDEAREAARAFTAMVVEQFSADEVFEFSEATAKAKAWAVKE